MKKVLVLGAGRSASTMIKYLLDHAEEENWEVLVGDYHLPTAQEKVEGHSRAVAFQFDVHDAPTRKEWIAKADLVISLLPYQFHEIVAKDCIQNTTHLVTASYVSDEMKALHEEAKAADVILLNELGADPGIDHMSAMEWIDKIHDMGGKIESFKSYCGAIVAPEFANIWGYKFTWAPRNVVLAGQGTAKYLRDGQARYIPYHHLFSRTENITVPGHGEFEAYANRDSLKYQIPYKLAETPTMYRATLRFPGYCEAWDSFVQLGLTDDSYEIINDTDLSWRDFMYSFLRERNGISDETILANFLNVPVDGKVMEKLIWLDLFSNEKIGVDKATPAEILQKKLEQKWIFEEDDKDWVVMQHQFLYKVNGEGRKTITSMVMEGDDHTHTAISKAVGLPSAIGAKLILQGKIPQRGVHIPIFKELYEPSLKELEKFGIKFRTESFVVNEGGEAVQS